MIESVYTNGETDKENKQTEENEVIEVDGVNKKNKIGKYFSQTELSYLYFDNLLEVVLLILFSCSND